MTEVVPLLLVAYALVAREAAHLTMLHRLVTTRLVDVTSRKSPSFAQASARLEQRL